jgi:predicted acetyltransferase
LSFVALADGEIVAVQAGLRTEIGLGDGRSVSAVVGCFGSVAMPFRGGGLHFALCRAQIERAAAMGAEVAVFNAASAPLCGARGGVPAGVAVDIRLSADIAKVIRHVPGLTFEVVPGPDCIERCRLIYERAARTIAGMPILEDSWWRAHVMSASAEMPFCLIARSAGADVGYLRFGLRANWVGGVGKGELFAQELISGEAIVRDALLLAATEFDHASSVSVINCSLGDSLRWIRSGNRGVRCERMYDHLWIQSLPGISEGVFESCLDTDLYCPFVI